MTAKELRLKYVRHIREELNRHPDIRAKHLNSRYHNLKDLRDVWREIKERIAVKLQRQKSDDRDAKRTMSQYPERLVEIADIVGLAEIDGIAPEEQRRIVMSLRRIAEGIRNFQPEPAKQPKTTKTTDTEPMEYYL